VFQRPPGYVTRVTCHWHSLNTCKRPRRAEMHQLRFLGPDLLFGSLYIHVLPAQRPATSCPAVLYRNLYDLLNEICWIIIISFPN
jgi:hypothetical protein